LSAMARTAAVEWPRREASSYVPLIDWYGIVGSYA
jgi:hypothetical protein